MKKTKKIILGSLTAGLLMSACAAVGVMGVNDTTKANAASLPVTGTATEAVTAEQALKSFTMENAAGVRTATPNGIRFETSISAADLATLPNTATFGTLIIPKDVLGANALNLQNTDALNIEAEVWRSKSTAETFVYSGVLIGESAEKDFPEAEYATDLVAVSYVTYTYTPDGGEATTVTKYTSTVTRNMAYVAASALYDPEKPNPDTNGVLANILAKSVTSVNVGEDVALLVNETANLNVETNVESELAIPAKIEVTGDAVTYENGVLTAVKAGTATVTATIGSVSDAMTITVVEPVSLNTEDVVVSAASWTGSVVVPMGAVAAADVVKATDGVNAYAWDAATATVSGISTDARGDVTVYLYTANAIYSYNVCVADTIIATAADWQAIFTNNISITDYYAVTADIDMAGYSNSNSKWHNGNTIDGRGHTISNFSTYSLRSNGGATFKNIALEYTVLPWVNTYPGMVVPGESNSSFENVVFILNATTYEYDTAVLANKISYTCTYTNCLFVVNVTETNAGGKIYADYVTASNYDPTFVNTYVVSNNYALQTHDEAYNDNGFYVKTSISQVGKIGDMIEVDGNAVLFNGKAVYLENGEAVEAYNNAASEITVNALEGKTVTKVTLLGETEERTFTQDGTKLSFSATTFLGVKLGNNTLKITTTDGNLYVKVSFSATTQVLNNVAPVLLAASSTLDLTTLGITGTPLSVTIKNQAAPNYSVVGSVITFTGVAVTGEQVLTIAMSDGQAFEVNVCFAYIVVSTAADFTNLVKGYGSSNANRHLGYYVAIANDIDMQGAVIGNSYGWGTGGTIDGRGHKIYNFTLSGYIRPVSSPSMTIKNLAMVYTSNPNASYYSLSLCGGNAGSTSGTIYENVYLEITTAAPTADLGVFGHTFGAGSSIKNSVVVLNVTGEGTGTIYADSTTASATKATFENAYVVSEATVAYHEGETYNNNGLYVKSSVSAITSIGGDFEVKADGLYYNNKLVKAVSAS